VPDPITSLNLDAIIASLDHWAGNLQRARAAEDWFLVDHTRRNIANAASILRHLVKVQAARARPDG